MKVVYFVSFAIIGNGKNGFGNTEVTLAGPITHIEQITTVSNVISAKVGYNVTILHYIPLRTEN